jgi:NDP-sugar pyrophosphorylase family protein
MQISLSRIHTVILAGAQSARIRPLSLERPKTLVPVCNQPILKRLLKSVAEAGLDKATLSLPLLWSPMDREILSLAPPGFDLRIGRPAGLFKGTVQDIVRMIDADAQSVLVISGDSLLSANLASLIETHQRTASQGGVATLLYHRPQDLREPERDGRTYHGVLSVANHTGQVVRFIEKPHVSLIAPGFDLANAAVFLCERSFLESSGVVTAKDFSHDVFQPTVGAGKPAIFARDIGRGYRIDVGTVKRFYDTNMRMLCGEIADPMGSPEMGRMGDSAREAVSMYPPVLIGEHVTFGRRVTLGPNAIVGNECSIGDGAGIENSILLDKCRVGINAKLDGAILGTGCRIGDEEKVKPFSVVGAYSSTSHADWPYSTDSQF